MGEFVSVLVDSALKGMIVAALALTIVVLGHKKLSASFRHLVCLLALVLMLVVPLASVLLQRWQHAAPASAPQNHWW